MNKTDKEISQEETNQSAIAILHEAIQVIALGRTPQNIWRGLDGINCDAIDLAIKTVEKVYKNIH